MNKILAIPYFIERHGIVLKYIENEKFKESIKADKFLQPFIYDILEHETPVEALDRMMRLELGIKMSSFDDVEILNPIFGSVSDNNKYHICILYITESNFTEFNMDKVKQEENIFIKNSSLDNIIIFDCLTKYSIDLFKNLYI